MKRIKTAKQMMRETVNAANNLPIETKRIFWQAFTKEGKTMGEARKIAGIDEVMLAAELVIQCHDTYCIPKNVEDIK